MTPLDSGRMIASVMLLLALTWPFLPGPARNGPDEHAGRRMTEWPQVVDGEPLRPLAMSDVERRFAAQFPGAIARFAAGDARWILRLVEQPTRMLHPAADCYRGLGYAIRDDRLSMGTQGLQRCFAATRSGAVLTVCERIVDADGRSFSDASSWYWAAVLGRSRGPWLAMTRAVPLARPAEVARRPAEPG